MISERLLRSVVCPNVGEHGLPESGPALVERDNGTMACPVCGRLYPGKTEGYLDLMALAEGAHTSLYVSHEAEFEETLDYKRISMPLLGAGVRQKAIQRMLAPRRDDKLIELGCGNGKFIYWNRRLVDWAVGIDPAPLFAKEALEQVDLCRADARALPFQDGTFTAAMSIDVLEHLPLADIETLLREAHRVLAPGGRMLVFSNTKEGSRLDFIVRSARLLSRWLADRRIIDDRRDRLRKSDHLKAIATYPDLVQTLRRCGFEVERVLFWNGIFQSIIENLVVKVGEAILTRRARSRRIANVQAERTSFDEVAETEVRTNVKDRLAKKGLAFRAMRLLTELMWLDLALFGKWRAGPYFVLVRRVELEKG